MRRKGKRECEKRKEKCENDDDDNVSAQSVTQFVFKLKELRKLK